MECPQKFVNIIHLFREGLIGQVLNSGDTTDAFTDAFKIINEVKRGCVLAPVLYNTFTCMLCHAAQDLLKGAFIGHCLYSSLFHRRRLTAKMKCHRDLLQKDLFSDD